MLERCRVRTNVCYSVGVGLLAVALPLVTTHIDYSETLLTGRTDVPPTANGSDNAAGAAR